MGKAGVSSVRRRTGAPGRDLGRRRADGPHRPGGRGARGGGGGGVGDHARACRRRRPAQGGGVRPAGRRSLRRDQRVHQEHPWLRSRRRPVLAGADAGGGGGRAVHRPAHDRPCLGGHRPRRPSRAPDSRGRGPGRGTCRSAGSAPQPGRGRHLPGARAEVEQRLHGAGGGDGGGGERRSRAAPTFATRPTRARSGWVTARGTGTRTTTRATRWSRSTGRCGSRERATTSPPARAKKRTGEAAEAARVGMLRGERPGPTTDHGGRTWGSSRSAPATPR